MNGLFDAINIGDRIAALWRRGECCGMIARELLIAHGFRAIDIGERTITARYGDRRLVLPGGAS